MLVPTRSTVGGLLVAVAFLATGCSDPTAPATDDELSAITLIAPAAAIEIGATVQFAATMLNAQGAVISGHPVRWESQHPAIASVTPSGAVTGLTAGVTTIRAISGAHVASATITVLRAICSAATANGTLVPGQPATGAIGPTDCLLGVGAGAAVGRLLTISQPTALRVELSSGQFAAFLLVTDDEMNTVDFDVADFPGDVAGLSYIFPVGDYVVWAATFNDSTNGSFTLEASPITMCNAATTTGTIAASQEVQGSITTTSCQLPNFLRAEGWAFSLTETTVLRIESHGSGIAPLLLVTGTSADLPIVTYGVPSMAGPTSVLHEFAPGDYRLWVTSFEDATGTYSLSMATAALPSCDDIDGTIAVGEVVYGELTTDDCILPGGRRADLWELTLAEPTFVRLDLMSAEIDTWLMLHDDAGNLIAEDDDSGEGLNSRIERTLEAGTYRLTATSYSSMALGTYALVVPGVAPGIVLEEGLRTVPGPLPKLKRVSPFADWR